MLPPWTRGSPGFGCHCFLVPSYIPSLAAGPQYAKNSVSFEMLLTFSYSLSLSIAFGVPLLGSLTFPTLSLGV